MKDDVSGSYSSSESKSMPRGYSRGMESHILLSVQSFSDEEEEEEESPLGLKEHTQSSRR